MSILIKAYSSLLTDISRLSGIHMDLPADFDENWILIEGPQLDKLVLASIEANGAFCPNLPKWLLPLWIAFTSTEDSAMLRYLRTILVFGYKTKRAPSKDQLSEAQKAFEEANQGVGLWSEYFQSTLVHYPMFREARRLVGRVIGRIDWSDITPGHGPGAVFPRTMASQKSDFDVSNSISEFYPYDRHFCCLHESGYSNLTKVDYHAYDKIVCNMVAVPKDSRGPRLISVHPKESIWIQQGQRILLEGAITTNRLTRGFINFDDQKINGALALSSSLDQKYTTIDLKEASDRVSSSLVKYLFGYAHTVLSCSRASHVRLLDGRLLELNMWAPMGNCLTFPVESLVFWALVRAGILSRHGQYCDDVYVFGDDLIVPSEYYEGAIWGLVMGGLIPNQNKTFRKGFFRESCGVDAFKGKDVTPFRIKTDRVVSYSDGESLCDLAKRLRRSDYAETSALLYSLVSRRFGRLSKTNNWDCPGLVEYNGCDFGKLLLYESSLRFNEDLHRWEVPYRRMVRSVETVTNHAWWHVQDSLLCLERKALSISLREWDEIPTVRELYNDRRLEYPHPRGVKLHRGWTPVILN